MSEQRTTRRHYLLGLGTASAVGLAGCMAENRQAGGDQDDGNGEPTETDETPKPDFGGWLDEANNYDGTVVDKRGQDEVTVEVGAGNKGLAFGPAAVHVDNGATIRWEWTGEGGSHNVVAEDRAFDSGAPQASGTFEFTFEKDGIYTYYCAPHKALGMLGAVVVGDEYPTVEKDEPTPEDEQDETETQPPAEVANYLSEANNYDGAVVDARGQGEVTVKVGVGGNGLAFGPAAIRVDNGTTVTWEWTGEGGAHNVVAEDGTFDSGSTQSSGTYSSTFEADGIHLYYCAPHKALGMKGAVIVGDGQPSEGTERRDEREVPASVDEYLADANNYSGAVVDKRKQDEVTVEVGAGDGLSFGPAAVHVDPGTTVVWQWTGEGGAHSVIAEDGTFDSGDPIGERGHTFEYTVTEDGIYRYYCAPHKALGMKGAVVVGTGSHQQ